MRGGTTIRLSCVFVSIRPTHVFVQPISSFKPHKSLAFQSDEIISGNPESAQMSKGCSDYIQHKPLFLLWWKSFQALHLRPLNQVYNQKIQDQKFAISANVTDLWPLNRKHPGSWKISEIRYFRCLIPLVLWLSIFYLSVIYQFSLVSRETEWILDSIYWMCIDPQHFRWLRDFVISVFTVCGQI